MKKILLTVFACMLCLAVFCGCQPKITVENALEIYDLEMTKIDEAKAFGADMQLSFAVNMAGIDINVQTDGKYQILVNEEDVPEKLFMSFGDAENALYEITYVDNMAYVSAAGTKYSMSYSEDEMKEYMMESIPEIPDETEEVYAVDSVEELKEQKQTRLNITMKSDVMVDIFRYLIDDTGETGEKIFSDDVIRESVSMGESIIFTEDNQLSSAQLKLDITKAFFEEYFDSMYGELEEEMDVSQMLPSNMSVEINFTNITTTVDIQAPEDADEYYSMDDAGGDIFGDDIFGAVTDLPAVVA